MALTGQPVDVFLLAPNQQAPRTAGPVGRIQTTQNMIATRFERGGDMALRLEKRGGFVDLPTAVHDPVAGGALGGAVLTGGELIDTLQNQLVLVANATPNVLAEDGPWWERVSYVLPTQALRQDVIYTANTQIATPDGAAAAGVRCYTWKQRQASGTDAAMFMILDADGTPIRTPAPFVIGYRMRVKVVSDGIRFWLFVSWSNGVGGGLGDNNMAVFTVERDGTQSASAAWGDLIEAESLGVVPWDVKNFGTFVGWIGGMQSDGGVFSYNRFTISGSVITRQHTALSGATQFSGGPAFPHGCAWIENNVVSDSHAYFASLSNGCIDAHALDLSVQPAVVTHNYPIAGGLSVGAGQGPLTNFAGYVDSSATVHVAASLTTNTTTSNTTVYTCTTGGVVTTTLLRSAGLASRAFKLGPFTYVLVYYPSVASQTFGTGPSASVTFGQPTFFLIELSTLQVAGRWDSGLAAMDWPTKIDPAQGNQAYFAWALPSPFTDGIAPSEFVLPLGYRASTFAQQFKTGSDIVQTFDKFVSSVGIKATTIGPAGQGVEYAGELLLPGPIATNFTGYDFSEHGITLGPEAPSLTAATTGGAALVQGVPYEVIAVYEWTTAKGDRARSRPSTPVSLTLSGTDNSIVVSGKPLYLTNHTDVVISIYMTLAQNGARSLEHYKVTNDLSPVLNDKTATTWSFTIVTSDAANADGAQLYTDTGELPHEPCPAFSSGCVGENRAFVVGYDGAVWFSAEKNDGEELWFSSGFRITLPTNERRTAIRWMDGRIIIFCERSIWYVDGGRWPDPTGQGASFRTPTKLPFPNGCTGFVEEIKEGLAYSSSTGGVWLLTRSLTNVQLSAPAIDDFDGHAVTCMAMDSSQRLLVGLGASSPQAMVFDDVVGMWFPVSTDSPVSLATALRGNAVVYNGTLSREQSATVFQDGPSGAGAAIISAAEIQHVHIGGVKNFKRVWMAALVGTYKGDHDLTVVVTYNDNTNTAAVPDGDQTTLTTTFTFTPDAKAPYWYELPPSIEECASMAFRVTDSFPRGNPGDSFALELFTFEVAIERGGYQVPVARRITGSR